MTFLEMTALIEKHYSSVTNNERYEDYHADMIKSFLDSKSIDYSEAGKRVILNHSKNFRSLPDIALFNKVFETVDKANVEVEAAKAYALLEKKSCANVSIAIEDPRLSHALQAVGGWLRFCHRLVDEEKWIKKDFIAAFKVANEMNLQKQVLTFSGELDDSDRRMTYIGNKQNIKLQLTSDTVKSILPDMTKLIVKE
jgi:hypothetical protein